MVDNRYFRCANCNEFFQAAKKRTYCTRRCRDAAYYKRKSTLIK